VIDATGAIDGASGNASDCLHVDGSSGSCGSSSSGMSPTFVDAEIPGGTLNGVNSSFSLANAPSPSTSLQLFRNGLLLNQTGDYSLSGNAITFLSGAIPQTGDALLASYRLTVSISGVGFVDAETPAGTMNGTNTSFTLSQVPSPVTSTTLYRNGLRLSAGLDYTISSNSITFSSGYQPQPGDTLLCWYRVAQ